MLPLIALLARAEELPTQEPEIVEVSYVSKLHGTLRGSISASSSSTASVKMVPSVTWVKHPSGDVASFREHSLSLWGKMEAPSGSGSWSVDAPLEGLSGGLSYSLFVKEAGNEYVASSDLSALAQAADACRKACDAQVYPRIPATVAARTFLAA